MSKDADADERPCLHGLFFELIEHFFADYASAGGMPVVDLQEVITAMAKTVAEFVAGRDHTFRQVVIEQLMREIMKYDAEFRKRNAINPVDSEARPELPFLVSGLH
jgi:hypothetical protein